MLSISALPLTSRMPGIVTVSVFASPSWVLPLTFRLAERVALFVTLSVPPRVVLLSTLRVEFNSAWPSAVRVPSILVLPVRLSTKNLSVGLTLS